MTPRDPWVAEPETAPPSEGVLFAQPLVGEEEIEEVVRVLRSGWITTGALTAQFEREFAGYVGAPAALAVNSCTAALHVALAAAGIQPGDVVATTPMTFCSTVHVIEQVGATPLLVDVEPDTLNLDPVRLAEAAERERLAAVVPVHFAGHPCDMPAIERVVPDPETLLLEDAAHALPARHADGSLVGRIDDDRRRAVAFSFYATKNLTTGEGGMLTASPALVDEARMWSLHGMSRDAWKRYDAGGGWFYEVVRPGFKYNLTDIASALGVHQLRKLDGFHHRRTEIAERYLAGLADVAEVEVPTVRPGVQTAWHLFVLRLHLERLDVDRRGFIAALAERGIQASVHFIPVHLHPWYRDRYGFSPTDFPVAYEQYERLVSLPLHLRLTDADVDRVIDAVADVARIHRR